MNADKKLDSLLRSQQVLIEAVSVLNDRVEEVVKNQEELLDWLEQAVGTPNEGEEWKNPAPDEG